MRFASSFIAFTFLSVVAAGVIPDIAARDATIADGNGSGKAGKHHNSVNGSLTYPSASSIEALHVPLSSAGSYSHSPALRRTVNPTSVHAVHSISRSAHATDDDHSHHSGSYTGSSFIGQPTNYASGEAKPASNRSSHPSTFTGSHPGSASQPTQTAGSLSAPL